MEEKVPHYPMVHLSDYEPIPQEILAIFPTGLVRRSLIIPVAKKEGRLLAVVPRTEGIVKPEGLRMVAGCPVDLALAPLDEIIPFIDKHYPEVKEEGKEEPKRLPPQDFLISVSDAEIPSVLKKILTEALKNHAGEILVEQKNENFKYRQRIKGVLLSQFPWQKWNQSEFLEIMAAARSLGDQTIENGIKWMEARRNIVIGDEKFSVLFRLSETVGQNVLSIHILPHQGKSTSPADWGMDALQVKLFENTLIPAHGLILFCGMDQDNVGDTMINCLRRAATPANHVMMIENQARERLPDVDQFSANGDEKLFGELLKINLRHRPDLLAADPLMKKENIESCLRAAMDGCRIFGRFFAWDAADAVAQMISLNVDPHLLRFGVSGLVTQRTLRMNCPKCQKKDDIRRDQTREIGIPIELVPPFFYRGQGCEACQQTGFDREVDIFEVIVITDEIRKQINTETKADKIRIAIKSEGMSTLRQIAIRKAIDGQTSIAEVVRTTIK